MAIWVERDSLLPTHRPVTAELRTSTLRTGAKLNVSVLDLEQDMPRNEQGKLDVQKIEESR